MATAPRTRKQPLTFRKDEVGYVMERWRASESCSLVGVGSVGKSNLLQHLADPDVQAYYMTDVAKGKQFKAIIIDPSLLGAMPSDGPGMEQFRCWAGYELMMHRLFLAFYPFDVLRADDTHPDDVEFFYETYQTLQDGNNPLYAYMGLRYFELGLELFMKRGIQIVFMFDEFEEMLKELPIKFFLTLRGIRDVNKNQLSYLTFTRASIPDVAERLRLELLDLEPFTELFNDNMYYVGPYNEDDARAMLKGLMRRNEYAYDDYTLNFLLWATGRYAGLLRAGLRALESLGNLDASTIMTKGDQVVRQMALKRPVRVECRTLWNSLTQNEQRVLQAFVTADPALDPNEFSVKQAFAILSGKRLIHVQDNRVIIEPPVFSAFIATDPDRDY